MFFPAAVECVRPDDVSQRRLGATYSEAEIAEVRFADMPSSISLISPSDLSQVSPDSDYDASEIPPIKMPERHDGWTQRDENRFQELAHRHALDTLEMEEKSEFSWLITQRRIYHHPLPFEQIAFEYHRSALLEEIQHALNKYVQFINLSNSTR